jgi:hypothetical protein
MFVNDCNEKIFQTLPGQGWRVLIQWNPDEGGTAEGFPAATLEPIVAWVTTKVKRKAQQGYAAYEDVIIAPLVRFPSGDELAILDSREDYSGKKYVYLAPGEELTQQHFDRLRAGGYVKAVTLG